MEPDLLIKASEYTEKLYKELTGLRFIAEIDSIKPLEDATWSKIYISKLEYDEEDGPYYSIEVECAQKKWAVCCIRLAPYQVVLRWRRVSGRIRQRGSIIPGEQH